MKIPPRHMPFVIGREPNHIFWADMSGYEMQEPFYDFDLESAVLAGARVIRSPWEALLDLADSADAATFSGFIFHMSRCGSTLIMNMLRRCPKVISISEPKIMQFGLGASLKLPAAQSARLLPGVVAALAQKRTGRERFCVIKLGSAECFFLPRLAELFPNAARIFMYRDPLEVLVSNMRHPSQSWMYWMPGVGKSCAEIAETLTPLESCALALSRKCQVIVDHADKVDLLVNYSEMSEALFSRILQTLRIEASDEELALMTAELALNAKDRKRRFQPDSARKIAEASAKMRAVAEQHLGPVYARLEALRTAAAGQPLASRSLLARPVARA